MENHQFKKYLYFGNHLKFFFKQLSCLPTFFHLLHGCEHHPSFLEIRFSVPTEALQCRYFWLHLHDVLSLFKTLLDTYLKKDPRPIYMLWFQIYLEIQVEKLFLLKNYVTINDFIKKCKHFSFKLRSFFYIKRDTNKESIFGHNMYLEI